MAVVSVIAFHAGVQAFSGGFIGVDVFFVISGYLITSIIYSELQTDSFTIRSFYERRARRILPALFFVILATLPFTWIWLLPGAMKDFSKSLVAVSVFSSNIYLWLGSGYFDASAELKPLLHTWSLAVEEQFYVLFPVFLSACYAFRRRWILGILLILAALSLAFAEWASKSSAEFGFFMLPARGWEILAGAIISICRESWRDRNTSPVTNESIGLVGLVLIVYPIIFFDAHTPFPGFYALIPVSGACMVILGAHSGTMVGRILGNRIFVGIGLVSYSAYLWHQPLFSLVRHRSLEEPDKGLLFALIILSFMLAFVSWKYVEAPFRNPRRISRNYIIIGGALGFTFIIAFGLVGAFSNGFAFRFDERITALEKVTAVGIGSGKNCHSGAGNLINPENACILGSSKKLVGALLGDSHANALALPLNEALSLRGIGLKQLTIGGCPPVFDVYSERVGDDCAAFGRAAYEYIAGNPDIKYVVLAIRWTKWLETVGFNNGEGGVEHNDELVDIYVNGARQVNKKAIRKSLIANKYTEIVNKYLAANKSVIIVYPVPEVGWNVPVQLEKEYMFSGRHDVLPDLSTSYELYERRNSEAIKVLDGLGVKDGIYRVKPEDVLCNTYYKDRCAASFGGSPLYFDNNHLSFAGAKLISDQILTALPK